MGSPYSLESKAPAPASFFCKLQGGTANFNSERVDRPARLVVDLPQAVRQTRSLTFGFDSPLVKRVRLGDQQEGVRVVFDLPSNDVTSEIRSVSGGLLVALQKQEAPPGTRGEIQRAAPRGSSRNPQ